MIRKLIAYGGMTENLSAPGDRRRFSGFADRNGVLLTSAMSDTQRTRAALLTLGSDLSRWKEMKKTHGVLILDIVDSYLDESRYSLKRLLRGTYKSISGDFQNKRVNYIRLLNEVITNSDAVVCASVEQKLKLEELNANVHAVVDCFEELLQPLETIRVDVRDGDILWEGFPENLRHFRVLGDASADVWNQNRFQIVTNPLMRSKFRTMTSTSKHLRKIGLDHILTPWSIENLKSASDSSVFAVIPISSENELAWNKSENKLLGLWALGIPVLVSATPSYSRVAKDAGLEDCLVSDGEWAEHLTSLRNNSRRRQELSELGLFYARRKVSAQQVDQCWGTVLESVGL